MALILILIGGAAGWRIGALSAYVYGVLAVAAIFVAGLVTILDARGSTALLADAPTMLARWVVTFLYLAVPYSALAWLKAKRIENRGD